MVFLASERSVEGHTFSDPDRPTLMQMYQGAARAIQGSELTVGSSISARIAGEGRFDTCRDLTVNRSDIASGAIEEPTRRGVTQRKRAWAEVEDIEADLRQCQRSRSFRTIIPYRGGGERVLGRMAAATARYRFAACIRSRSGTPATSREEQQGCESADHYRY